MAAPDLETLEAFVDPAVLPRAVAAVGGRCESPSTRALGEAAAGEQRAADPAVVRGGSEGEGQA